MKEKTCDYCEGEGCQACNPTEEGIMKLKEKTLSDEIFQADDPYAEVILIGKIKQSIKEVLEESKKRKEIDQKGNGAIHVDYWIGVKDTLDLIKRKAGGKLI